MTPADFATLCPLMAEEDQPSVQRYIDSAVPHFDIERWGAFYAEGLAYYVAHQITVQRELEHSRGDTATRGDVISQTVGGVATTRDATLLAKQMADPFQRTTYGQHYRWLAKKVGRGLLVVG